MIESNDIVYVLSGGPNNVDPAASLGGDPSSTPVLTGLNNLFANVSATEATSGNADYRCVYVFNNNLSSTLWNCNVFQRLQVEGGTLAELGTLFADEIQNLTIIGEVTGGILTLSYEGSNFTFSHSSSLSTWVANFQSAIRSVATLQTVVVSAQTSVSVNNHPVTVFTILYTGSSAGNRFQPILTVVTNALTPTVIVSTSRAIGGSPINSIAPIVDHGTTAPTGVTFDLPTVDEPLLLGNLGPTDGFPLWVRRTTPAGSLSLSGDGLSLVCSGTVFP